MTRTSVVYMAINWENGKRYIGVTSRPLHVRATAHVMRARQGSQSRIHGAIRKYGRDAFDWLTLATYSTFKAAALAEISFIAQYRPEYNVKSGGEGGGHGNEAWNKKPVVCLSTGQHYDSATAAAMATGSTLSCVAQCCNLKRRRVRGLCFAYAEDVPEGADLSLLATERVRLVALKAKRSERESEVVSMERRGRPVVCTTDGRRYASASEAARAYNVPKSGIIELCLGKRNRETIGGFAFRYDGELPRKGVRLQDNGRYRAYIHIPGTERSRHLGCFATEAEAIAARKAAELTHASTARVQEQLQD